MAMDVLKDRRDLMKGYPMAFGEDPRNPELQSDQRKGVAAPPLRSVHPRRLLARGCGPLLWRRR
jgi:hypothetical protein